MLQGITNRLRGNRPELVKREHPTFFKKRPEWKKGRVVLDSRLKELLVFELNTDGNREYKTMNLRGLYTYVLTSITTRPAGSAMSTRYLTPEGNISPPSTETRGRYGTVDMDEEVITTSMTTGVSDIAVLDEGMDDVDVTKNKPLFPNERSPLLSTPISGSSDLQSNVSNITGEPEPLLTNEDEGNRKQVTFSLDEPIDMTPVSSQQSSQKGGRNGKPKPVPEHEKQQFTYRERLGGYLHPRDMRRLVTPFSSTNEPEIIVRRHVILLNMDPLRAIVLRDRLLVLVPNGADSILQLLETRVRGGLKEMERSVFDDGEGDRNASDHSAGHNRGVFDDANFDKNLKLKEQELRASLLARKTHTRKDESETSDDDFFDEDDEWHDMHKRDWIDMPFELQSVDAVLHVVCKLIVDEANDLREIALDSMDVLLSGNKSPDGEHGHDVLRRLKNETSQMNSTVLGFIRALNLVLDDDEDLALMNLSRLITHPERFILPVPEKVLHEESDEPELILEAYLQEALSTTNALDSVKNELNTTEELMNMQLDAVRNRLLYINTVTAFMTFAVTVGSFIGSIFGMNLINPLQDIEHPENETSMWNKVVLASGLGGLGIFILLMIVFDRAAQTLSIK